MTFALFLGRNKNERVNWLFEELVYLLNIIICSFRCQAGLYDIDIAVTLIKVI
jgi:hypothetical protein